MVCDTTGMEINEDTPYEQGYKRILAAERKAYMRSSVVGDGSRREHLETAREHVSSALDRDQRRESVVGETTERIIAGLSRSAHGGQEISFSKYDNAEDMISVENPYSGKIEFGISPGGHGVDVFVYSPDDMSQPAAAMTVSTPSWDSVCIHLVETDLHPEWSYARQFAFGSPNVTMHQPRGLIVKQEKLRTRLSNMRRIVARLMGRQIYTALELTDGSTVWERWS